MFTVPKHLVSVLLFAGSVAAFAQENKESPVFKAYRPHTRAATRLTQTDATAEIWDAFMASRKAHAGDVLAQHELGLRYLLGQGFEADTVQGAYWIQQAAEKNLLPARYNLGILLSNGWGVAWDPFKAYREFMYCAETGMPEAQYIIGILLTENLVVQRNLELARTWLVVAADSGYAPAKTALQEIERRYAGRTNHERSDSSSALVLSLPADPVFLDIASEGDTSRGAALTQALRSAEPSVLAEIGLPADISSKLDSMQLASILAAADIGSPEALVLAGRCYEEGIVVRVDLVLAGLQYLRAVRMDSPRGMDLFLTLMSRGLPAQVKSRASRGDPDAQFVLGDLTALGMGVDGQGLMITEAQAMDFLSKAASKGHKQALIDLGLLSYSGKWVVEDRAKAFRYWEEASRLGSKEAQVRIAIATVRDPGDSLLSHQAVRVLYSAVQQGSILATVGLAYCYETGSGVPANEAEAARQYRSGAHRGSQDAIRALRRMYDRKRPGGQEFRIVE